MGKRVYWPGSGMQMYDFDLLEVGSDVVFGSRSHVVWYVVILSQQCADDKNLTSISHHFKGVKWVVRVKGVDTFSYERFKNGYIL